VAKKTIAPTHVELRGLDQLAKDFKAIDTGLPKQLQIEFKEISAFVVDRARRKMPRISGVLQGSIRPVATSHSAGISRPTGGDRTKGAYYPWMDFGGGRPDARGVTATSPIAHERSTTGKFRRPVVKGGRYLYPAIAESTEEIGAAADLAVVKVARAAGWEAERG
jgi:hypothetical protein